MTERKRLNTKLESEAAEFLVLGRLLLERISAFKVYVNFPGYDLIVTNAKGDRSARIQVKSRYQTDWDGFIIKNYNRDFCDFVILVTLNRGFAKPNKRTGDGIKEPEYYVLPVSYIENVRDPKNTWGKITRNRLTGLGDYKDRWDLIIEFLNKQTKR